ncbi:MAG: hypothetical protein QXP36_09790 [Conexivisphaerales archaeon]
MDKGTDSESGIVFDAILRKCVDFKKMEIKDGVDPEPFRMPYSVKTY